MSNYYTPKNRALNAVSRTKRPYPIVTVSPNYRNRAIEAGTVSVTLSLEEISTDIRMIVIGNVFEWCLRNGDTDFAAIWSVLLGNIWTVSELGTLSDSVSVRMRLPYPFRNGKTFSDI